MSALWLALVAVSWAEEPCPSVDTKLMRAENHAAAFQVQELENELALAVEAFGCSAIATEEQQSRFWQAQAMLWTYGERRDKAERAWAAARRQSSDFNADYGDANGARFEAVTEIEGDPSALQVSGLARGEWVAVDGEQVKPTSKVIPGMHLVQVGGGEVARYARTIDVEAGANFPISVPAGAVGQAIDMGADAPAGPKPRSAGNKAVIGLGAASLVASGTFFAISQVNLAQFKTHEGTGAEQETQLYGYYRGGAWAAGTGIAGLGLLATGIAVRF